MYERAHACILLFQEEKNKMLHEMQTIQPENRYSDHRQWSYPPLVNNSADHSDFNLQSSQSSLTVLQPYIENQPSSFLSQSELLSQLQQQQQQKQQQNLETQLKLHHRIIDDENFLSKNAKKKFRCH